MDLSRHEGISGFNQTCNYFYACNSNYTEMNLWLVGNQREQYLNILQHLLANQFEDVFKKRYIFYLVLMHPEFSKYSLYW